MARKGRARFRALIDELARVYPEIEDPRALILRGDALVNGIPRTNPMSHVRVDDVVTLRVETRLRGEAKLCAALRLFDVLVERRIALDVGAAAGGFTRVLLDAGAAKVYAVDAGHGQLLGSLRQDPRVVNLESTNVAQLDGVRVPDVVEVLTLDLSYVPLRKAVPQLSAVRFAPDAEAIALVKPQFELGLARLPREHEASAAVPLACSGFQESGWHVVATIESPTRGAGGALEFLLHARRGG